MKNVIKVLLDYIYETLGSVAKPHIQFDARENYALSGSCPFDANDDGTVTLNLSTNAVGTIHHYDEYMSIECAKDGYRVRCVVYYDTIMYVYERSNGLVGAKFALKSKQNMRPTLTVVK